MITAIPLEMLAASLHCAGVQDIRYYLNGVHVEIITGEVRLVACNGALVSVLRYQDTNAPSLSVTIPRATVELAVRTKTKTASLFRAESGDWSIAGIHFTPVDGTFPSYRRVVPSECNGQAAHFDPALIAQMAKVGKSLRLRSVPCIRQNGEGAALVHIPNFDNFVGVIMPMRLFNEKNPDTGAPTWASK